MGLFWIAFVLKSLFKAYSCFKGRDIETVVTFAPFHTALCCIAIMMGRLPAVTYIRADNMKHSRNYIRNGFFYLTDWLGVKLSSKVFVVSNVLKRTYQKRYGIQDGKIGVQPNNIENRRSVSDSERANIRKSIGIEPNEFLIISSGVFNEGKNFSFLIGTMKHLAGQRIKLAIVGDELARTGERKRLQELVTQLGLQSLVKFCGWQDDPAKFVASSDLYVHPSKHEGSPNALLEALGSLVPCLGSKIEEIEEVLEYDELLFPLDNENVLAQKVLKAAHDPAYYSYLKELSLMRCERYSFKWGDELLKNISSL